MGFCFSFLLSQIVLGLVTTQMSMQLMIGKTADITCVYNVQLVRGASFIQEQALRVKSRGQWLSLAL